MYLKPIVLPLTDDGFLYALFDESGRQIAAGSKEVCHTLLYLLTSSSLMERPSLLARDKVNPRVRRRVGQHLP